MNPLRWMVLQVGIAGALLLSTLALLSGSASAVIAQQPTPPIGQALQMTVPTSSVGAPVLLPTVTPSAKDIAAKQAEEAASDVKSSEVVSAVASQEVTPEATPEVGASEGISEEAGAGELAAGVEISVTGTPTYYVVAPGDTLFVIARDKGSTINAIMDANGLTNPDRLDVGQLLLIPASDGTLPDPALEPVVTADGTVTQTVIEARGTITERMTSLAQQSNGDSPYYDTTWLTYYGRPHIDVMGILGEYSIDDLIPLLREQADAYERANGDSLKVTPAFHLVYGMATTATGDDNSHLAYMGETEVISYIEAAKAQGWGVILDVQIGALTPTAAISPALSYLSYPNVHLAIDPEFAMSHAGQRVPGNPIGFVTAEEVNAVQAEINRYLADNHLPGPRILLVHQFQSDMIVDIDKLDTTSYPHVALTLSVDGWGGPWGKISKYNSLVSNASPYTAFKLFYRWDEPLLLPDEALGNRPYRGSDFSIDVTPNMIIYQ